MRLSLYPLLLLKGQLCWRLVHVGAVLWLRRRVMLAGVLFGLAGASGLNWWLPEIWRSTAVIHVGSFEEWERETNLRLQPAP